MPHHLLRPPGLLGFPIVVERFVSLLVAHTVFQQFKWFYVAYRGN
jgi:hypothetical protein